MLVHRQDALEGVREEQLEGGEDQRGRVGQPVGVPGAPELCGRRALLLPRTHQRTQNLLVLPPLQGSGSMA